MNELKVLEVRYVEDNDYFMFEHESCKDEKMFEYLKELDFNKLIEFSQVSENETIEALYEFLVNDDYERVIDFASDYYDSDNVNTFEFKQDCVYELGQYYLDTREAFESVVDSLGLHFGTVGHSGWSYYIARKDISHTFISDLWEGYNYYDVRVTTFENGIEVDVDYLGAFYNPSNRIEDFDINGYDKIMNNDVIGYFNVDKDMLVDVDKVNMIKA